MSYAKDVFDNIVKLEQGSKIAVLCQSKEHMNSLRALLYREKVKFITTVMPDYDVIINTKTISKNYYIFLTKTDTLSAPLIIDAEGNTTGKLVFERKPIPVTVPASAPVPELYAAFENAPSIPALSQRERINQAMREDGLSEEEIAEYWNENPPEDMSIIDVPGDENEAEK